MGQHDHQRHHIPHVRTHIMPVRATVGEHSRTGRARRASAALHHRMRHVPRVLALHGRRDARRRGACTMLGTSEPVMATITAVAWAGETFTFTDLTGFAMIIIMVFLVR